MMVSQPRRIAASSLMKRLRTTLGDKVSAVVVVVVVVVVVFVVDFIYRDWILDIQILLCRCYSHYYLQFAHESMYLSSIHGSVESYLRAYLSSLAIA
jgi:uncharacterized membrane protein YdbT with pleckstrin-like domain